MRQRMASSSATDSTLLPAHLSRSSGAGCKIYALAATFLLELQIGKWGTKVTLSRSTTAMIKVKLHVI